MRNLQYLFLIVVIFCCINFFDLQSVKGSFVRYIQFGILIVVIVLSLPTLFTQSKGFDLPVQLIFGSILFSVAVATLQKGQSLVDSFVGSIPILVWSVFFYLKRFTPTIQTLERIIVSFGVLYLILYFFQFTHPTSNYFVDLSVVDDDRGILRIVFPGRGLFYLSSFIAITKLTTQRENRIFWSLLAVSGLVVTVMQVTRQFIFGALIIYLFHFFKNTNYVKKLLLVVCAGLLFAYIFESTNPIIVGLRDTQQQTQEAGAEYIRLQAAQFFLTDFSTSTLNHILGNGVPYGADSPYYHFYKFYVDNYGFWLSDVGLIAIYAMFGVGAVLGYLLIWINSFTIRVPEPLQYVQYYLWFLLITSFTSDTIYSPNDLIATVLAVYVYQMIYEWIPTSYAL